jgi:hypothetical protein
VKTALKIITFVVVVGLAAWAFFYLLKGVDVPSLPEISEVVPIQIGGGGNENAGTPEVAEKPSVREEGGEEGLITQLSNGPAFAYIAYTDEEIYYFSRDGKVFQAHPEGDIAVSEKAIPSLNGVFVSASKKRALVSSGDPKRPTWSIYDVLDRAWRPLPTSLAYASWGGNDETLIGINEEGSNRALVRVNLVRNTPVITTLVSNFRMRDITLAATGADTLLLSEKPSAFYTASAWELSLRTLSMRPLFREAAGLIVRIFGGKLGGVAFEAPNRFSLLASNGSVQKELAFATLPEKCGASGTEIYCFAPGNLPEGSVYPDDYFKNTFSSTDSLHKIDPVNGSVETVLTSGSTDIPSIDGRDVSISARYIYFINKHGGALYRISRTGLSEAHAAGE